MSDLTFGEWAAKRRPAETWKEPKSSFAAWHEKEYGGGSSSAPAAPAVRTDPTVTRPTADAPAADYAYKRDSFSGTSGKLPVPEVDIPEAELPGEDIVEEPKYSVLKGIAGGVQKGLTDLAQTGGNAVAMYEDIQYAPLEVVTGRKIGEFSDNGPLNQWNDSIDRAAERVEDYYADNIAAGGAGAEFLDKAVRKTISFVPQMLYGALTGGTAAVPELTKAASREIPGTAASIRTMVEKLVGDPQYWLSVAETTGERYQDAQEKTPTDDAGGWLKDIAGSAGESLYKEAVGTSDVVPDWFSTLLEIAYEMYDERREKQEKDSWLETLIGLFL